MHDKIDCLDSQVTLGQRAGGLGGCNPTVFVFCDLKINLLSLLFSEKGRSNSLENSSASCWQSVLSLEGHQSFAPSLAKRFRTC